VSALQSRVDWSLHTLAGRLPVLDGTFGFDRGWTPQGQGSYTMPLAEYEALHPNAAPNPSFDVDASSWGSWRVPQRITGDPIAGAFGRVVGQAGDPYLAMWTDALAAPGEVWDVSLARFRTNVVGKWAELEVTFMDASLTVLTTVTAPRVPMYAYWEPSLALANLTAPAGAVMLRARLRVHNSSAGGGFLPATGNWLDVDDIRIVRQVLRARQRQPVLLTGEVWLAYSDGLGELALSGAGSTLGGGTWPPPVAGDHYLPYGGGTVIEARARDVAWHVWPRDVVIDEGQQTATIELATIEALLQDATNLSGVDIEPQQSVAGTYFVGRMLSRLAALVGVQITVPSGADFTTASVEPWRQGQSLWDWFTRVRSIAGLGYYLDAETNTLNLRGIVGSWPFGSVTDLPLERSSRVGAAAVAGLEFADALTLTWRWSENGIEQTSTETVVASSLTSWREATRAIELEREGRPIPGVAQRIVDNLVRLRKATTVVTPTTANALRASPLRLDGGNWQSARYGFTTELATITILQEA
jgi:hypothetical protein